MSIKAISSNNSDHLLLEQSQSKFLFMTFSSSASKACSQNTFVSSTNSNSFSDLVALSKSSSINEPYCWLPRYQLSSVDRGFRLFPFDIAVAVDLLFCIISYCTCNPSSRTLITGFTHKKSENFHLGLSDLTWTPRGTVSIYLLLANNNTLLTMQTSHQE